MKTVLLTALIALMMNGCGKSAPQIERKPAGEKIVDTVYLVNGGTIQGQVVKDTPAEVSIRWQDGIVSFKRSEVKAVKRGEKQVNESGVVLSEKAEIDTGAPETFPRVYLKDGTVKKGVKVSLKGSTLMVGEPIAGGGFIEFTFPVDKVEKVVLWPPSELSKTLPFEAFAKTHPQVRLHKRERYLLLSDDDPIDFNLYLRSLEQFYDEFVMYWYDFIRADYKPKILQAVILGNEAEFNALLKAAGFPEKARLLGFFVPDKRILFLYNVKGAEMVSRYLRRSTQVEGMVQNQIDRVSKMKVGDENEIRKSRYLGQGERILEELQKDRAKVEGMAQDETVRTIRHEGAHQLLYEFDVHAKKGRQGAWLVEGLASFCEPPAIGEVHETRLMELKFELEKHHLMPLEYLLTFAAGGDIHQLEPSYTSLAYAESWAFVHFLMSGPYREGFLQYVREVPKQGKDFDEKQDVALFEKYVGKTVQQLDEEFPKYVDQLIKENVDPKVYEEYRLRFVLAS